MKKKKRPYDIGKYDVVGYAETDGNYTEVESNKVTFEIKNQTHQV